MIRFGNTIPITIHPIFWLVAVGLGWLNSISLTGTLIWTVVIVLSILIHEFGHALTARAFGQDAQIDLVAFGGVTKRHGGHLNLWKEFVIVLNGPLAGLCLYLIASLLLVRVSDSSSLWAYGLSAAVYVNLFWTLLNLLPIQPLDGGKLLSIPLEGMFGFKGVRVAIFASILIAAAIGILFILAQAVLPAAIFFILAFESYRSWQSTGTMAETDRDETLQRALMEAEKEFQRGNYEEADRQFLALRHATHSGIIYLLASELYAKSLVMQDRRPEAYAILDPMEKKLGVNGLTLLQELAFQQSMWKRAATVGAKAYKEKPSYAIALLTARAHARMGEVQPALGWLRGAIQEGLPNPEKVLGDSDFDALRNSPDFQVLRKKYS